jgi:hypothetical protein
MIKKVYEVVYKKKALRSCNLEKVSVKVSGVEKDEGKCRQFHVHAQDEPTKAQQNTNSWKTKYSIFIYPIYPFSLAIS